MSTKPDIQLTITGQNLKDSVASPFPLRLMTDENGTKLWKQDEILREIGTTGFELKYGQTDWQGGHGHGIADSPIHYASGRNIDTTQKGKFILGPLVNTTTITN